MDENILLSNISAIIAKDILIDESMMKTKYKEAINEDTYTLDLDLDEEYFFQHHAFKTNLNNAINVNSNTFTINSNTISKLKRRREKITSEFKQTQRFTKLNILNELESVEFEKQLHMTKKTFVEILKIVQRITKHADLPTEISTQTALSVTLWKLTTNKKFEYISRRFQIPLETCVQILKQFCTIIAYNYECFIKWPRTQNLQQRTINSFKSIAALRKFPKLIGIITLKQLDIFFETNNEKVSIIFQLICNAQYKVIDCFVEFAQKYNFDSTPIGLALSNHTLEADTFLIGGKYFPLKPYLMRPFETTCDEKQTFFNCMLEPAINMAGKVLDIIGKRFNILYALKATDLNEVRRIIETLCCIHNICIDSKDNYLQNNQFIAQNWTNASANVNIQTSESNILGVKRRFELIETIIKNKAFSS